MGHKLFSLSVKVVIRNKNGECLLLKRSMRSSSNPGKWEFPGGVVDRGEILENAIMRETMEETGLTIQLDHVAGSAESEFREWRVAHLIMEGRFVSGKVVLSDEHDDYQWIPIDKLPGIDMPEHFTAFAVEYIKKVG
jgi:8-oxo-dGTP diphosphatase